MKVYVVYQENGFGGSEVAEVFSSRGIAREYVIDEIFGKNQAYKNKTENVLNNCADQFIHEHDVLFNWRYRAMSKRDPIFPVYKRLKERIESDTVGAEITEGEAEISYNNLIYWVEYSLTREFNTAFHDFDTEPDNRSQTFVSIHDYAVWDQAGEAVSCSFDPHALESMFSQPDFDY